MEDCAWAAQSTPSVRYDSLARQGSVILEEAKASYPKSCGLTCGTDTGMIVCSRILL